MKVKVTWPSGEKSVHEVLQIKKVFLGYKYVLKDHHIPVPAEWCTEVREWKDWEVPAYAALTVTLLAALVYYIIQYQ